MVEVFKTTVDNHVQAFRLLEAIHRAFPDYSANFDLDDCDRILRVVSHTSKLNTCAVIHLIISQGCFAEILNDELQPVEVNPSLQKA
ncbi:hypothetical protein [uncultured Imperialibacter sp.]|uniref:hypothetical protein n=1 Tax=uncultured Imperialibacter sp. TaxID=1672639 RepID=UPI0030DAAC39|tara:strand:+ start:25565 stop:25825 length:261 start_codon:yes stop_codon:yes gene_type:complete